MISLFIDTSTKRLIIGLYKNHKELFLINEEANNDLSSKVLPRIKQLLDDLKMTIKEIDEIYIVNGPGSFTGIRVGVTIAKTIAWALNKDIYPVSELQLLATHSSKKYIVPMIDARRGYVYAGMYDNSLKNIIPDQYIEYEEMIKLVKKQSKLSEIEFVSYDGLKRTILPEVDILKLLKNGKFEKVNAHHLNPNYLKKTEAEEKLNDKKNN